MQRSKLSLKIACLLLQMFQLVSHSADLLVRIAMQYRAFGKLTSQEFVSYTIYCAFFPGRMCSSQICANGGKCVLTTGVGGYRCECLAGWRGENCTEGEKLRHTDNHGMFSN